RIDGTETPTWDDVFMAIVPKANRELTIALERDGQIVDARVTPDAVTKYELGEIGVSPKMNLQLTIITPEGPAAQGGLQLRDVILAVDGETNVTPEWLTAHINASSGRPVEFRIRRDGQEQVLHVTPEGDPGLVGIGWSRYETKLVQPG